MITEDYVSFEVAKLLKEKGFYQDFLDEITPVWKLNGNNEELAFYGNDNYPCEWEEWYSAPTLQMTMKWLREVHKIHIQIWILEEKGYWFDIEKILNNQYKHKSLYSTGLEDIYFETYEQACEAAIKYCLENLI